MLDISEELKNLYKQQNVYKQLRLYFPELDLTIVNNKIFDKSFILTESLCSSTDLNFGSCESAMVEVTVADLIYDITGKIMVVSQVVDHNEEYIMPLGTYIVDSAEKQSDRRFKKITAYDYMQKADIDVANWYNGITFPITLKDLKESLLTYIGIEPEEQVLLNDDVLIEKTINPESLNGRDILSKIVELYGGNGHITRLNKFKVIQLSGLGLYPSEELYPSEDLFPSESGETIVVGDYKIASYEEYIVEPITIVKIAQDDEDSGVTSGDGTNALNVIGNYLLFGKNGTDLQAIADNIFLQVKNKFYRPHTSVIVGYPWLEVGDSILIITTNGDAIESFIFKRVLTGIHSLTDTISATGNKTRSGITSPSTEIKQLKSKTLVISKSVDALSVRLTDTENNLTNQLTLTAGELDSKITNTKDDLESQITQTATDITQQVTDVNNNLQAQINTQAGQIALKVDAAGVISAINLSPGTVKIEGAKIDLVSNAVSIVGKLYLNLNDNDTAVYAVSSGGTSNVISYKTTSNPSGNYEAVVVGDTTVKTAVYGDSVVALGRSVFLQSNNSSGYVDFSSPRSSGGSSYSARWDGQYLYALTNDCYIGSSSFYWNGLYFRGLYHYSSGTLGFFGASQHSKTSVSTMSTSGSLSDAINKINELRNALNGYGLV
jgi:hypothetical protein